MMQPYENVTSERINRYLKTNEEERSSMAAVPSEANKLLNANQKESFETLNYLGWKLKFVRREKRNYPLFVFEEHNTGSFASIEQNGDITINPEIHIRN